MPNKKLAKRCVLKAAVLIAVQHLELLNQDLASVEERLRRRRSRQVMFDDPAFAEALVWKLAYGHDVRIYRITRLKKYQFIKPVKWMVEHTTLTASRSASIEQKLMVFLFLCGTGCSHRTASEFFHRSTSAIHQIFHTVLPTMCVLHPAFC
jgi:hypothetical protein